MLESHQGRGNDGDGGADGDVGVDAMGQVRRDPRPKVPMIHRQGFLSMSVREAGTFTHTHLQGSDKEHHPHHSRRAHHHRHRRCLESQHD